MFPQSFAWGGYWRIALNLSGDVMSGGFRKVCAAYRRDTSASLGVTVSVVMSSEGALAPRSKHLDFAELLPMRITMILAGLPSRSLDSAARHSG